MTAGTGKRNFEKEWYVKTNQLISDVHSGTEGSVDRLIEHIYPAVEKHLDNIAKKFSDDDRYDEHEAREIAHMSLKNCIKLVKKGKITGWNSFSIRFQTNVNNNIEYSPRKKIDDELGLQSTKTEDVDPVEREQLRKSIQKILEKMNPRQREVLEGHFLLGESLKKIGELLEPEVTKQRVCQIEASAIKNFLKIAVELREEPVLDWLRDNGIDTEVQKENPRGR